MFATKGPGKHRVLLRCRLMDDEKDIKPLNSDFTFIFWIIDEDLEGKNEEQRDIKAYGKRVDGKGTCKCLKWI